MARRSAVLGASSGPDSFGSQIIFFSASIQEDIVMLHYALVFLVIAIIAAVRGFGGIAGAAAGIAKILFIIFLILAVLAFFRRAR
jgi:uncharacterized membrane protein YtjA (UPF0391 family)